MFRDLKKIWETHSFTSQIVADFSSMLEYSSEMLSYASKVLVADSKGKKGNKKIYLKDKKINITEKEIQKRILIHLSINPRGNLPACLALLSMTKDAERVGDYVKLIFELHSQMRESDYHDIKHLFKKLFSDILESAGNLINTVNRAFMNSDTELALETAAEARAIALGCDSIIEEVSVSDYPASQVVILVLGARYFRQLCMHLLNISSAIYLPIPETDHLDITKLGELPEK